MHFVLGTVLHHDSLTPSFELQLSSVPDPLLLLRCQSERPCPWPKAELS